VSDEKRKSNGGDVDSPESSGREGNPRRRRGRPDREGLKRTPGRVARMYAELLAGAGHDPAEHLLGVFEEQYDEIVLLRDIPFYSVCEHHLMPFIGKAHVAYLPRGKVLGVSKLARIVDALPTACRCRNA